MNIQQCRLFFSTATSNTDRGVGLVWKRCFRPCGWIAAMLSAALLGCTSLTPDRINVLAAIAGQAAAVGAEEWLAKHPEHRDAFNAAIAALVALQKNGNTNEDAFVELMSSLPVNALRGPEGELYVAGAGGLVVWDAVLQKGVVVRGKATAPVMKATLSGLKRALAPKPPAPVVARARKAGDLEGRAAEGENVFKGYIGINNFEGQKPYIPTNKLHITGSPVGSTFTVTLNEHGIQQVNVRWVMAPNALYTVQRKEDKDWEGYSYAQNTNTVATPWVWTTLWPAPVAVGTWRVVRAR